MNVGLYSFLTYPTRKAHAPYYNVICGLSGCTLYYIFTHYLKEGTIYGKK